MSGPWAWLADKFAASYTMWGTHDSLHARALARLGGDQKPAAVCLRCRPAQCCRQLEVPLTPEELASGYYRLAPGRRRGPALLRRNPDGACTYLVDELCSIYPHRPVACRDYDCCRDSRTGVVWPSS
ncbi:MAG: YkgJ family cysteine cluster protein [Pseudomonadota bacterium]